MWGTIALIAYGVAIVTVVILFCVSVGTWFSIILSYLDRGWKQRRHNSKDKDTERRDSTQ